LAEEVEVLEEIDIVLPVALAGDELRSLLQPLAAAAEEHLPVELGFAADFLLLVVPF
jgi:hypothetical protein